MRKQLRSRKCTRMMLCLLSALLMITSMPLAVSAYDSKSDPIYEDDDFVSSMKIKNSKQRAIIEYIYADFERGNQKYKGSGQCYGYAEKIRKMFGTGYKKRNYGVKLTKKNFYNKLKKAKPGTHVRIAAKKNGGGTAHSVVLLKVTKNTIWYTDGNVDYNNGIRYSVESLSYFCGRHRNSDRKYLVWSMEPKGKIPGVKDISVKINAAFNGPETHVVWLPVKSAKKYIVYRSTKKSSGYKKIAETKACVYSDRSTDLFGKVYYKVKAVRSGKSATSKPAVAYRKVESPVAYLTAVEKSGKTALYLSFDPVPGAVKYKIYKYDDSKDRPVIIATVKGPKWRYTDDFDGYYLDLYITASASRSGSESFPVQLSYY